MKMDFQLILCVLMVFDTSLVTATILDNKRDYKRLMATIPKDVGKASQLTPAIVCDNRKPVGMQVQSLSVPDEEGCPLSHGSRVDLQNYIKTRIYKEVSELCNGYVQCNFHKLNQEHKLRGCKLLIHYRCRNETDPGKKDDGNRNKKGDEDDGQDDEDGEDDRDSGMMQTMILITIAVSVIAVLAVIIIVILCGLFVCGWSSRFERWDRARPERTRLHHHQQRHQAQPMDEYAYIDQNALLSNSKISTTTPSPEQPTDSHLRWKTADVCGSLDPSNVPSPNSHSASANVDDYTDIAVDKTKTSFVSPKATGGKKPMVGGVSMRGLKHGDIILQPSAAPLVHPTNPPGPSHSIECKVPVASSNPYTEPVQYTLPIPKSQKPEVNTGLNAHQSSFRGASNVEQEMPGCKLLGRNLSHPGKPILPSLSLARLPAPSRPAPTLTGSSVKRDNLMSSARRASLPRHSKLMENDTDLEKWAASCQTDGGNHSTSQPSLVKHSTGLQSQTQLYSHLGSQQVVPVLGNVYSG
ncbi:hypothetical protein ElyMa_005450700 [Elysia marginata]|uniref:Uncharacterized protein n=1 Tax=Elysia marginata TaxID=1093978 RepID=A0AAV4ENZ3_9GAST|nr:hypothetical protein ElyMa_005450700 [Elysia marginata]